MNKAILIMFGFVFLCSCATRTVEIKEEPPPAPPSAPPVTAPAMPPEIPVLAPPKKEIEPLFGDLLSQVTTSKTSFNPSQKEEIALSFSLSRPAKTTVYVYDPDHGLIKTLIADKNLTAGEQTVIWDGKDADGQIVPDEAYFFTVVAADDSGTEEIYDPTTFSGGEEHDLTTADIDPVNHTVTYRMPEMGRVMIRMGIQGGPLMNQLVDWKPRVKGVVTEYWNGKDRDNLVDIYDHPKFKMIVAYFSLPENSVITYGNKETEFIAYKKNLSAERLRKPERPTSIVRLSHHYSIPRTADYCPEIRVAFSNTKGDEGGMPILQEKTMVKVALDEQDKAIFQNSQFEICFFLDHEFYAEDEAGYTPFNWVWDLSNVEEGEHLLTVNISSFKDQIGVLSKKVKVVK